MQPRADDASRPLGAGCLAYGTLVERNAFTVRRFDVPVLPPGATPLRVLHVSDLHITAGQRSKHDWIRGSPAASRTSSSTPATRFGRGRHPAP